MLLMLGSGGSVGHLRGLLRCGVLEMNFCARPIASRRQNYYKEGSVGLCICFHLTDENIAPPNQLLHTAIWF